MKSKNKFYLLSFTWGILMTSVGLIVATSLLAVGIKPKKWGWCYHFEVGKNWGGLSLGFIILTGSKSATVHTKCHEHGHSLQNCYFGPAMIFISLWSAGRYWLHVIRRVIGATNPPYDSIWFEWQASLLGTDLIVRLDGDK